MGASCRFRTLTGGRLQSMVKIIVIVAIVAALLWAFQAYRRSR